MYSEQFSRLLELERLRKISIGIHRDKANNYLYGTSLLGKLLNWGTNILFVLIVVLVFINLKIAIGFVLFVCLYVVAVQKIATFIVRKRALGNADLFNMFYKAKVVTIKDNGTGQIYHSLNSHWAQVVETL